MENDGTFYVHLEYITAIWYILCSFDIFLAIWSIFSCFGKLCLEKSGSHDF
jgi:hypothetical protein